MEIVLILWITSLFIPIAN